VYLSISIILLLCSHVAIWFSTNAQLIKGWEGSRSLFLSLALSIPITLMAYYATRFGYKALESLWSVRFLAFSLSYLVFPVLTWVFLKESPFTAKTVMCTVLSFAIVAIQLFLPDT
jgi:hypothetical protein